MRNGVRVECKSQGGAMLYGRIDLQKFGYRSALSKLLWRGE
jgi:hypothetical protein